MLYYHEKSNSFVAYRSSYLTHLLSVPRTFCENITCDDHHIESVGVCTHYPVTFTPSAEIASIPKKMSNSAMP